MARPRKSPRKKSSHLKDEVVSTVKRMLPVEIDEKLSRKKEHRISLALTEKKEQQEKMNEEILPRRKAIKELEGEIETLRAQVIKGTEDREVVCDVIKDYKRNLVVVRRRDTGDVVEDRTMTAEDRQEDIEGNFKAKRAAAEDKPEPDDTKDVEDNDPGETEEDSDETEVH